MTAGLSLLATLACAVLVYLASPHQRLTAPAGAPGWLRIAGLALLAAGVAGWSRVLQGLAIGIVPLTLLMLAWVLLPYLDAGARVLRAGPGGVEDRPRR